jgi:hypothetical protein
MVPYVVTLLALGLSGRRSSWVKPPAALGKEAP